MKPSGIQAGVMLSLPKVGTYTMDENDVMKWTD